MANSIYDFTVTHNDGTAMTLKAYQGTAMLIVNTASRCGFTPQYAELEAIYRRYHDRGLVVLGFPCNQFGGQEPGDNTEIMNFCTRQFQVSFPLFAKIEVNGEHTHPLYQYLKSNAKGVLGTEAIKWNFTKFLVNREGMVVGRYAPTTTPEALIPVIETLL